ncbi:MAG: glycoside hydrolase, partial [Pseudopedobacter saltans]
MIRKIFYSIVFLILVKFSYSQVLVADSFKHYVDYFNIMEDEPIIQAILNSASWDWMKNNIPLFESPDTSFNQIYYFRWWT